MSRTQRWTLVVVCAATAMLMLDIAVVNTALSAIAADLDTGLSGLQWVIDAYTVPLAAMVITAGSLADRFGRRRVLGLGLGVFTATSLLCAAATVDHDAQRLARRARARRGAHVRGLAGRALARVPAPRAAHAGARRLRRDDGRLVRGRAARGRCADLRPGLALDLPHQPPARAGLPVDRAPLRRRVAGPARAARGPCGPRDADRRALPARVRAAARQRGWAGRSPTIVACFAGAVALLGAFVAVEARVAQPMLPLRLFRNPSFTGAQVAAFGISASLFAVWLYLTLYLQQILGLSAIEAGLVFVPGTLLNFLVAGSMASVGQKVSPRVLIATGLALVGAGQALLTIVGVDSSWWLFLPGLLVAMVGTGILNPIVSQVALSSAPPEQSGLAAGVNDMFRQAGIAVGVAALGALIPAGAALGDGSPQSYVDGLHDALWVGAVVALACAVATALLIRGARRDAEVPAEVALESV